MKRYDNSINSFAANLNGDLIVLNNITVDVSQTDRPQLMLVNLILSGTTKSVVTPEVMGYLEALESDLSSADYRRLMEMVKTVTDPVPTGYTLAQNYPNPFNPETEIAFGLPENADVILTVYNVLGQVVTELVNGQMDAGYHTVMWDASQMPSGVYFYALQAEGFSATKRMVLMK